MGLLRRDKIFKRKTFNCSLDTIYSQSLEDFAEMNDAFYTIGISISCTPHTYAIIIYAVLTWEL